MTIQVREERSGRLMDAKSTCRARSEPPVGGGGKPGVCAVRWWGTLVDGNGVYFQ